jgi:RNA polymerase sigma-70 factor (ECF subfamily)
MGRGSATDLDAELARLADGDRSVFPSVFATLWPVIHRFCARALGSEADADDAAQATMQKLFLQVGDYERDRSAAAWALTIAAWECRTIRRRTTRGRTLPLDDLSQPADPQASPEAALVIRDLEAAARAALEQLAPGDQATLKAVAGEISRGPEPGATFRKRKQRALSRLREAWTRMYGTPSR